MKKTILLSLMASSMLIAGGNIEAAAPAVGTPSETDFALFDHLYYNDQLLTRHENVDGSVNDDANAITTLCAHHLQCYINGRGLQMYFWDTQQEALCTV